MGISHQFSERVQFLKLGAIRAIGKRATGPDFISFVAGQPAPAMFPTEAIKAQSTQVLEKYGPQALQYGPTEGFLPLREIIAEGMPAANAEDVLIISGSQQAIDLAGKLFLDPGDKLVLAAPTYSGALSTFNTYGVEYLGVTCDQEGMLPEALEAALRQSPQLIYCIPNFMNPTGVDMSLDRRRTVVELAQKYGVPILEDDPYGALRFEGEPLPSLFELAPKQVMYAGTYSKILVPGLRLAWIVAKPEIMQPLIVAKQTTDLQSATFTQRLVYELSQNDFMTEQIDRTRAYYHQQRNHMLEAVDYYFPQEVTYTPPAGGLFLWCELPEELDTTIILEEAIKEKVAYMPGTYFFPNGGGQNTLRLSYSVTPKVDIGVGIKKLSEVFSQTLA